MSVVHFQCPSCQAPLRLENRALFVGRSFDCPDCRETLLIEADGSTGVKARPLPPIASTKNPSSATTSLPPRTADKTNSHRVTDLGVLLPGRPSVGDRLSRRPAVLGWIVAALCAVILFVAVSPNRQPGPSGVDPLNVAAANSEAASSKEPDPAASHKQPKSDGDDTTAMNDANELKADANPVLPVPPLPAEATVEPPRDNKPNTDVAGPDEKPPVDPPKPVAPPAPAPSTPEAIEAKLQQKIARFDQAKPVAFIKVLDTIEELAGVPIVWDLERVDEQHLQKNVTLSLKQTTVAEILDTLLKQVGLERRTIEGKIELRPAMQKE